MRAQGAMKKTTERRYRYVSKDGTKHTRWQDLTPGGFERPNKHVVRRLGKDYGVEVVRDER